MLFAAPRSLRNFQRAPPLHELLVAVPCCPQIWQEAVEVRPPLKGGGLHRPTAALRTSRSLLNLSCTPRMLCLPEASLRLAYNPNVLA